MPRVGGDLYQLQTNAPGPAAIPGAPTPAPVAQKVGHVMTIRGRQEIEARDSARALMAFNRYREAARQKIEELSALELDDAFGAVEQYQEWSREQAEKISAEMIKNGSQRDQFLSHLSPAQQRDMKVLGRHSANQLNKFKAAQLEEHGNFTESEIRDIISGGYDDMAQAEIEAAAEKYTEEMYKLYPKTVDYPETVKEKLSNFYYAAGEQLLETDPESIGDFLTKNRDSLGEFADELEKKAKPALQKYRRERARIAAQTAAKNDPLAAAGMINDVEFQKVHNLEGSDIDYLQSHFMGRHKTAEYAKNLHYDQQSEQLREQAYQLWTSGDVEGAMRIIDEADPQVIDPATKAQWRNMFQRPDKLMESDPRARAYVFTNIGKTIKSKADLIPYSHSLSETDYKTAEAELSDWLKGTAPTTIISDLREMYKLQYADNEDMLGRIGDFESMVRQRAYATGEYEGMDPLRGEDLYQFGRDYITRRVEKTEERSFGFMEKLFGPKKVEGTQAEFDVETSKEEKEETGVAPTMSELRAREKGPRPNWVDKEMDQQYGTVRTVNAEDWREYPPGHPNAGKYIKVGGDWYRVEE